MLGPTNPQRDIPTGVAIPIRVFRESNASQHDTPASMRSDLDDILVASAARLLN